MRAVSSAASCDSPGRASSRPTRARFRGSDIPTAVGRAPTAPKGPPGARAKNSSASARERGNRPGFSVSIGGAPL